MSATVQNSTFNVALPYGLATLAVGAVGAISAITAATTAGVIMGVALAILGAYSFLGVVSCGITSKNPEQFQQNIWQHMATSAGTGIAGIIAKVAEAVILNLIFGRNRERH